jgi:GT2 family glycosyltransferase
VGDPVTVAIPVRNGTPFLDLVLSRVKAQQLDRPLEILVADSGSTDGSQETARRHGAAIIEIRPDRFSHGGTRNLLSREATGTHIALLTQDAVPTSDRWLATLLDGFRMAADVALVFGPYRPRADASHMVRRELDEWFRSLSPDGSARLVRELPSSTEPDAMRHLYFTDANACISRSALEQVPFREVAYAEDQLLARDMLAAGYAKVYRPDAPVTHSHEYGAVELFKRSFDEWRGLREVHAITASASPVSISLTVQRSVRDDVQFMRTHGVRGPELLRGLGSSAAYHSARAAGAMLGSRAGILPPRVRALCSLEGRRQYDPVGVEVASLK